MATKTNIAALSGKKIDEISASGMLSGKISGDDIRISSAALEEQAKIAEREGRKNLAENFYRAAELTRIPDQEVIAIYNALRPGRSTKDELLHWIERLEHEYKAIKTAELIKETLCIYEKRGVLRTNLRDAGSSAQH